jgi:hypothetical protein
MVLLENGDRGLAERLASMDVVLHAPRAREAVQGFEGAGRAVIELTREISPRTRERLQQVVGPAD